MENNDIAKKRKEKTFEEIVYTIIFWNTIISLIEMILFLNPGIPTFIICFIFNLYVYFTL